MKITELLPEVFNIQRQIPDHAVDISAFVKFFQQNKQSSKQVASSVWLGTVPWADSMFYFLEHESGQIMAWAKTTPTTILNETHDHLDFVYVVPQYRHGNTIQILLYSLKEIAPRTLIVDGALFLDGQRVISKFIGDHTIFHVHVLNKKTGEIAPFRELVNDPDKCYMFLKTHLPFHQQYMPAPFMEAVWLWDLNLTKL